MKLVFSTAAEADLEAIGDYIALENPLRAVSYIREIRGKCMELREMPRRFRLFHIMKQPASTAAFMATT